MHLLHPLKALTLSLSSLIHLTNCLPAPTSPNPDALIPPHPLPLPVHIIHEFPKGTWVENLALRPSNQILTTLVTSPDLYQIDPLSLRPPILIHSFQGYTSLTGIVEVDPDVFYIVAGNFSLETFTPTPGSSSVFEVNLNTFNPTKNQGARIRLIADFPDAVFLNGATLLSRPRGEILLGDSAGGTVWYLNVRTGAAPRT
ncbi:MAG: hypothetical protein LQ338_006885, partial [Usnochroma carphineum]